MSWLRLRRASLALSGVLSLAASACSSQSDAERDFDRAQTRWHRAGLVNYSYKNTVVCFCGPDATVPMTVTVRNGVVVRVVDRVTGATKPLTYRTSIDSLFSQVAEEIRVRPGRLQVTYDAVLGFPRSLTYGTPENDGGGFITADSVAVVP